MRCSVYVNNYDIEGTTRGKRGNVISSIGWRPPLCVVDGKHDGRGENRNTGHDDDMRKKDNAKRDYNERETMDYGEKCFFQNCRRHLCWGSTFSYRTGLPSGAIRAAGAAVASSFSARSPTPARSASGNLVVRALSVRRKV